VAQEITSDEYTKADVKAWQRRPHARVTYRVDGHELVPDSIPIRNKQISHTGIDEFVTVPAMVD